MSARPAERTLDAQILGRRVTFDYSETWVAWSVLSLRIIMGWVFLQAGIEKLLDPDGWSAAVYLENAVHEANPLADFFAGMAGSPLIDALVMWGQVLIGIALILGILVRWSAFWGAIMMLMLWLSHLQGGLLAGLPVEHGYVVDDTMVYTFLLFGLGAVGAGRILGVDRMIEGTEFVRNNPWLKYLLG